MSETNINIASSAAGGEVVGEEAIRKAMLEAKDKLKAIPTEISNPEEFFKRSTQEQAKYLQNNGFEDNADDEPVSDYDERDDQTQDANEEPLDEERSQDVEKKKKRRYSQSERRAIAEERENRRRIEAELEHERIKNVRLQAQIAQERAQLLDARQKQLEMEEYKMSLARQGALEEGDYRTEAKTNETLMDLRFEKKQLEYERQQLLNQLTNAEPEESYYQQQTYNEQQPRLTREQQQAQNNYYSFVDRHPELDRDNPNDFSRDAERLASELSSKLSIRYKRSGLGDQIFSEQYFNDLDQLYDRELGFDSEAPSYNRSSSSKAPSRYVSPVRGSGNSMSGLGSVKRAGTLSDAERRIAENFGKHLKTLDKNASTDKIVDFYKRMKKD